MWGAEERAARKGKGQGCPPDMGEDGMGSEGGGGGAEHIRREKSEASNDGKTSVKYARGLRESGTVGAGKVMLVGFRMRNEFRERLVTRLKVRLYHGKKAGQRVYWRRKLEGEMSRQQDVPKMAA